MTHPKAPLVERYPYPKAFPENKSSSFSSDEFKERAKIKPFGHKKVPTMVRCDDCNDDLSLGCFRKRNLIWGGSQKQGVAPTIENATDYLGRINQAANALFPLGMDLPISQEVQESLNWIANTDPSEILSFWTEQIDRLRTLARQCSSTQEQWWKLCPPEIRGAQKDFCSVAFRQLVKKYSLG